MTAVFGLKYRRSERLNGITVPFPEELATGAASKRFAALPLAGHVLIRS